MTSTLLSSVLVTGAGSSINAWMKDKTFQAIGSTTAGAGACVVLVQASNDDTNWITIGTITLTLGVTATSDGFASDAQWAYIRGNVQSISGTNASVTLIIGHP